MSERIRDCRSFILAALTKEMHKRRQSDNWIENERTAVAAAANAWGQSHGLERRVTVADVERIEVLAVGHVDYASKLALYVAESVIDPTRGSVA